MFVAWPATRTAQIPAGLLVYRDIYSEARANRADLLKPWLVGIVLLALLLAVPVDAVTRGAVIGATVTALVLTTLWVTIYIAGFGDRLHRTWAERFTNEELAKTTAELTVIPDYRYADGDIDHAVVSRHGVYAIEAKSHCSALSRELLERDAADAARHARHLKAELVLSEIDIDIPKLIRHVHCR